MVHAIGVLAAPANTAIKPSPAKRSTGEPVSAANVLPNAAPIKNRGVTSPPLNPVPMVTAVNAIFHNQLQPDTPPDLNALTMEMPLGSAEVTPSPQ